MYQKQNKGWKKHLDFIFLDLVSLYIAYVLAFFIRHNHFVPSRGRLYLEMFFVFFFLQFTVSVFGESFKNVLKRGYYQEFIKTFYHVVLVILLATFYLFIVKEGAQYSRATMLLTSVLYASIGYLTRILRKQYLLKCGLSDTRNSSLLIVTSENILSSVIKNLSENNYERYKIPGIVLLDTNRVGTEINGYRIVADKETLLEYICGTWVDEILLILPRELPYPETLMENLTEMGITTHIKLYEAVEIKGQKHVVERIGGYTVLTSSINMASYRQAFGKRCLDIIGGLVGCMFTVILCIVVGPLIYIKSPGPIFFSQERIGKNGKRFRLYKFRSMYLDAEERKSELMVQNRIKDGMMFKLDHDPRIIGGDNGIGTFIRKHSIDEFPQFWNVLKGDMSLVGTRPPTVDEYEKYDLHHMVRLAIKPGITGLWQVSGRSKITDFNEVVKLDREYITNWSLGRDLRILLKTVFVVLGKDGAM